MHSGFWTHGSVSNGRTSDVRRPDSTSTVEDGDILNLVLLKLVEYLGHPNALLNGLAYDDVRLSLHT